MFIFSMITIVISAIMLLFVGIIWSKENFVNILFKMAYIILAVFNGGIVFHYWVG